MNLPDDLQIRRQQAMEQAMEMYRRAQKKGPATTPDTTATNESAPPATPIEVEVLDEPFGSRSIDYSQEVIDLPPEERSNEEEFPPFEEGDTLYPELDKQLENPPQASSEPYDWEVETGNEWKEGFRFQEPSTPSPGEPTPSVQQSPSPPSQSRAIKPNDQTPNHQTTDAQAPKKESAPREITQPEGYQEQYYQQANENQNTAETEGKNASPRTETDGYKEQYHRRSSANVEPQIQRSASPPTDSPIYDHEGDRLTPPPRNRSVTPPTETPVPTSDPVTRDQPWSETGGYTEQYYENEDTYEEFSNGHTEEQPDDMEAVPTSTGRKRKSQRDKIRQNDIRYGNLKHQDHWKQKEPPKQQGQKPPQNPGNQFGDDALLWLLLMSLMEEEKKNTELIMALLYLLMG